MPLVPVKRTTQTGQGEINSGENHSFTTEIASSTRTPGIETNKEIRPEVRSRTVEEAYSQTNTSTEAGGPKVTTQLEAERTTVSTNNAHQVRTLNAPSTTITVTDEDAVMDIEFTIRFRDLLCLTP